MLSGVCGVLFGGDGGPLSRGEGDKARGEMRTVLPWFGGVPPAEDAADAPEAGVSGPAGVLYGVPGK